MPEIRIEKSKYKGVLKVRQTSNNSEYWKAQYKTRGHNWTCACATEKEAAIAFDKKMIEIGEQPVNVLVRRH